MSILILAILIWGLFYVYSLLVMIFECLTSSESDRMDNAIMHAKKDEIVESSEKNQFCVEVKPEDVLLSSVNKVQISHFCIQKLCVRCMCGLNKKIPKQITILEEKILRYCLELMHTSASRDNLWIPQCFCSVVSSRSDCDASFSISFGDKSADTSSYWDPIAGSITRSILNNPLIRQLGALDDDVCYSKDQKFGSESLQKRLVPLPRTSLFYNDSSNAYHRGMLECSWDDGFPRYDFCIEGKRKVFITTNLLKVESFSDMGVDYVYMFHSRAKESGLRLLGEMRVSTSFELCPHGTEIMETRFVLCANGDDIEGDGCNPDRTRGKNKGLSKVSNIFKSRSYKQRSFAVEENLVPKLELAAIVLKDRIRDSRKEVNVGGWGLKFLRKDDHCESCSQITSMNVVVPAGFHGGPRSRNGGGPSSLVERWRSGGSCDCGGWDLGCPLTVLHQDGDLGDNVSFDLFVQGRKKSVPVLKMANVGGGLYDLRYESTLSPLQSLSIAVAAIHGRSPILRPRLYAK